MDRWRLMISWVFGMAPTVLGIYCAKNPSFLPITAFSAPVFVLLCMAFAQDDGAYRERKQEYTKECSK